MLYIIFFTRVDIPPTRYESIPQIRQEAASITWCWDLVSGSPWGPWGRIWESRTEGPGVHDPEQIPSGNDCYKTIWVNLITTSPGHLTIDDG